MDAPANKPVDTWKTVVVILLLLIFYPVGLIFMFIWMKWPMWVKLILTGIFVLWIIAAATFFTAIIMTIINPNELTKRSRDATRLTDMASIQEIINKSAENTQNFPNWLCNGLPGPCGGNSVDSKRKLSEGEGWIKINFNKLGIKLPGDFLVDPVNLGVSSYRYCSDGKEWEIDTKLESEKHAATMIADGGDSNDFYEIGSNLKLCK